MKSPETETVAPRNFRSVLLNLFAPDRLSVGRVLIPVVAIILALLVGVIFIIISGHDPLEAYWGMLRGAIGVGRDWQFGDPMSEFITRPNRIGNTMTEAFRLILVGLAVSLPLRVGLLNIGAPGQIIAGGLLATVVGLSFPESDTPSFIQIIAVAGAGFLGGFLWGALAGILRAYRNLNEIITTIMLNFIAFWLNAYLVQGVLRDPDSFGYDWSPSLPVSAQLPLLIPDARINVGILFALAVALALYILLWHTTIGFEWRATGVNAFAAYFAGMRVKASIILAMGVAGGIAGLAGGLIISGSDEARLTLDFAQNYGFDGIPVAFIGQTHPLGVVLIGLFFGALSYGSDTAETFVGVPKSISEVILALTMLFVIISQSLTLARWMSKKRTESRVRAGDQGPAAPSPAPSSGGSD
jgi:simple sugar transport system permease protein